jgi:hypothetical protein
MIDKKEIDTMDELDETNKAKLAKKNMGRKSRASGKTFEKKCRTFLEGMPYRYIVARWTNNLEPFTQVDGTQGYKMIPSAPHAKFNPFFKRMQVFNTNTGFPDFFGFYPGEQTELIGFECKKAKYLSKEEKDKCQWYLREYIFSRIFVMYPGKKRGVIEMDEIEREEYVAVAGDKKDTKENIKDTKKGAYGLQY